MGQLFMIKSFSSPFLSKLSIDDCTTGVPETLIELRVLQNGEINKELTPFYVTFEQ